MRFIQISYQAGSKLIIQYMVWFVVLKIDLHGDWFKMAAFDFMSLVAVVYNNNKRLLRVQNRAIGETDGAVSPNTAIMRDLLY